jgi:23S rRNA A2030 N6-methylase RlmJ
LQIPDLKDTALTVTDTHAGAGLYRLTGTTLKPAAKPHLEAAVAQKAATLRLQALQRQKKLATDKAVDLTT